MRNARSGSHYLLPIHHMVMEVKIGIGNKGKERKEDFTLGGGGGSSGRSAEKYSIE